MYGLAQGIDKSLERIRKEWAWRERAWKCPARCSLLSVKDSRVRGHSLNCDSNRSGPVRYKNVGDKRDEGVEAEEVSRHIVLFYFP